MSRCAIFAHTYVTLTWTSQTRSFCTRNGFPRGSQMAFLATLWQVSDGYREGQTMRLSFLPSLGTSLEQAVPC